MKKFWIISLIAIVLIIIFTLCFFLVLFPVKNKDLIISTAKKYDLNPSIVFSVINIESGWDEKAVSSSGALGVMQIMPSTGKEVADKLGIKDFTKESLFEFEVNLEIGCYYLRYLLDRFEGDETLALCGYNAGPNVVSNWMKDEKYFDGEKLVEIPYKETKNYIKRANFNQKVYDLII